jgi:hypothetical protein
MRNVLIIIFCCVSFCALTLSAQLAITVSSPKIAGKKAVVPIALRNNFNEKVVTRADALGQTISEIWKTVK